MSCYCVNGIVGPFFFDQDVTGDTRSYVNTLTNNFFPAVSSWSDIEDRWFQHDGASAHFSKVARTWLDQHFTNRWIGRRGEIEWPPRFPDLTLPDFFLWGVVKNDVYKSKPSSV